MYILLGILQGITEWLPVSSSGQSMLALINLLHTNPQTALSIAIYVHTGTLLAVLVRFREDFRLMIKSYASVRENKIVLYLIVSTLITALVGLPTYILMKKSLNILAEDGELITAAVGLFLVYTGVYLFFSRKKYGQRDVGEIKTRDMIIGGAAQGLSIIPGVSRSGVTVSTLLFLGFRGDTALKLSFLMSVPAVLGALGLDLAQGTSSAISNSGVLIACFFSFISGYATMDLLLKYSKKIRFDVFCVIFGLTAVLVSIAGVL